MHGVQRPSGLREPLIAFAAATALAALLALAGGAVPFIRDRAGTERARPPGTEEARTRARMPSRIGHRGEKSTFRDHRGELPSR